MKKIILTESQIIQIRNVLKEQEEPQQPQDGEVFTLVDIDGQLIKIYQGTIEYEILLMGQDQNENEIDKLINLVISFSVEPIEQATYDYPGGGGDIEWTIESARQTEPEEKDLSKENIDALLNNSMISKYLETHIDNAIENEDTSDYGPDPDDFRDDFSDDLRESIKKTFNRFL
jgi:hypothetical protein